MQIPPVTGLVFMKLESERVPRKNLRDVGGRPLYRWIFDALEESSYVNEVILNTDSEVIAEEVSGHYPEVRIHMRPPHLLEIQSNEANQIIEWDLSQSEGEHFLQTHSTNPLVTATTLDSAVRCFFGEAVARGHDSLFSVTPHQKRFYQEDGTPINHDPAGMVKTQHLSPLLEENSCVYVFSRSSFKQAGMNRIGRRPFLFRMAGEEALDIDTEDELELVDLMLRTRSREES